jgi:NAD-dependent dihydropyrimidine dehydrogenase PreA subunit
VGLSSCTSDGSCEWYSFQSHFGSPVYYSPDSTIIQDGACQGDRACADIARNQGESLVIEPNACVGDRSCLSIGRNNADSVTIQSEACVGDFSCYGIGGFNAESVRIDAGACDSDNECGGSPFAIYANLESNVQCFAETTPAPIPILATCRAPVV